MSASLTLVSGVNATQEECRTGTVRDSGSTNWKGQGIQLLPAADQIHIFDLNPESLFK
jgi:hypothetical protein